MVFRIFWNFLKIFGFFWSEKKLFLWKVMVFMGGLGGVKPMFRDYKCSNRQERTQQKLTKPVFSWKLKILKKSEIFWKFFFENFWFFYTFVVRKTAFPQRFAEAKGRSNTQETLEAREKAWTYRNFPLALPCLGVFLGPFLGPILVEKSGFSKDALSNRLCSRNRVPAALCRGEGPI